MEGEMHMSLVTSKEEPNSVEKQTHTFTAPRVEPKVIIPGDTTIGELVQLFKLLADDTRLRILSFLQQTEELNVREFCRLLRQRQPSVSHHLALLRSSGILEMRREGKHNFYRLNPA